MQKNYTSYDNMISKNMFRRPDNNNAPLLHNLSLHIYIQRTMSMRKFQDAMFRFAALEFD